MCYIFCALSVTRHCEQHFSRVGHPVTSAEISGSLQSFTHRECEPFVSHHDGAVVLYDATLYAPIHRKAMLQDAGVQCQCWQLQHKTMYNRTADLSWNVCACCCCVAPKREALKIYEWCHCGATELIVAGCKPIVMSCFVRLPSHCYPWIPPPSRVCFIRHS